MVAKQEGLLPDRARPPQIYKRSSDLFRGLRVLHLMEGVSPFGYPPEYPQIKMESAEQAIKLAGEYAIPNTGQAEKHVRNRFELGEKPIILFSDGGSDEILERIVLRDIPDSPARIYYPGPTFPDIINFSEDRSNIRRSRLDLGLEATMSEFVDKAIEDRNSRPYEKNVYFYFPTTNSPKFDHLNLDDARRLASATKKRGDKVIFDGAHDDWFPENESAVRLTEEFDNVCFLATLSKAVGIPGEKLGIGIFPNEWGQEFSKKIREYPLKQESQIFLDKFLDPKIIVSHLENIRPLARRGKIKLMSELELSGFKYLPTDENVPGISIVGDDVEFYNKLTMLGVETANGNSFWITHPKMTNQIVRAMLPAELRDIALLMRRVRGTRL